MKGKVNRKRTRRGKEAGMGKGKHIWKGSEGNRGKGVEKEGKGKETKK